MSLKPPRNRQQTTGEGETDEVVLSNTILLKATISIQGIVPVPGTP